MNQNLDRESMCGCSGKVMALTSILVLVSVLKLVLSQAKHIAMVGWGTYDDGLFLEHASSIASGKWLGPYNDLTLIKGAAYPCFIAINFLLGVPLHLGQEILLLVSYVAFATITARTLKTWWTSMPIFLVLAFTPISTVSTVDRVLRDLFNTALTFLLLAGLQVVVFQLFSRRKNLVAASVTGVVGGVFYNTREDTVWFLPTVLVLLAYVAWEMFRTKNRDSLKKLVPITMLVSSFVVVVLMFAAANFAYYRIFSTSDFLSGPYFQAYGALQRIHQEKPIDYVPVPESARGVAYSVSPTLRQLEPQLESPLFWRRQAECDIYSYFCRDIGGGWFFWALRDAAKNVGKYRSPEEAGAFWVAVAKEINEACENGKIECDHISPQLSLPFRRWNFGQIARGLLLSLNQYVAEPLAQEQMQSVGAPDRIQFVERMVGGTLAPFPGERNIIRVAGWFASPKDAKASLYLAPESDGSITYTERTIRFKEPIHVGGIAYPVTSFVLTQNCTEPCKLHLIVGGTEQFAKKLNEVGGEERAVGDSQIALSISLADHGPDGDHFFAKSESERIKILAKIAELYRILRVPVIVIAGLLFVWLLATRRMSAPVLTLITSLIVAGVMRIALVGFLTGTSFFAVHSHYMLPAFPIIAAATILVFILAILEFTKPRQRL